MSNFIRHTEAPSEPWRTETYETPHYEWTFETFGEDEPIHIYYRQKGDCVEHECLRTTESWDEAEKLAEMWELADFPDEA